MRATWDLNCKNPNIESNQAQHKMGLAHFFVSLFEKKKKVLRCRGKENEGF
jgi:hypothetical protein